MHCTVATILSSTISNAPIINLLQIVRKVVVDNIMCSSLCVSLALAGQAVMADEQTPTSNYKVPTQYAGGITIGSLGLGLSLSSKTNWSLTSGDQLQWRILASGIEADFKGGDGVDRAGIDYEDSDFSFLSLQGGIDWYPVSTGWADEVFFSTGLMYVDTEFKGTADNSKTYFVGNTQVAPGDISALNTSIESSSVMPYVSLGWGSKIKAEDGFNFQIEVGVVQPTNNPDVTLTAVDPSNILNASALASEKKEIEDEVDGIMSFATVAISYHF